MDFILQNGDFNLALIGQLFLVIIFIGVIIWQVVKTIKAKKDVDLVGYLESIATSKIVPAVLDLIMKETELNFTNYEDFKRDRLTVYSNIIYDKIIDHLDDFEIPNNLIKLITKDSVYNIISSVYNHQDIDGNLRLIYDKLLKERLEAAEKLEQETTDELQEMIDEEPKDIDYVSTPNTVEVNPVYQEMTDSELNDTIDEC